MFSRILIVYVVGALVTWAIFRKRMEKVPLTPGEMDTVEKAKTPERAVLAYSLHRGMATVIVAVFWPIFLVMTAYWLVTGEGGRKIPSRKPPKGGAE